MTETRPRGGAMSLTVAEEKQRARLLSKQPFKEGHYKFGGRVVRVRATLYPSIAWWIESVSVPSMVAVPGTREPLTQHTFGELEPFL